MKNPSIAFYILFLVVAFFFWRLGDQMNAKLQSIYAKPEPEVAVSSFATAKDMLKESYDTQRDLALMVDQMHGLHTKATVLCVLFTLPIIYAVFRKPKKEANQQQQRP
jgi:hypothetical protein